MSVAPAPRTTDRRSDPEACAEAGIPTYLRVELRGTSGSPELVAFSLHAEGRYRESVVARGAGSTPLPLPFPAAGVADHLSGPRR